MKNYERYPVGVDTASVSLLLMPQGNTILHLMVTIRNLIRGRGNPLRRTSYRIGIHP